MPEAKRDWYEAQLESAAAAGATILAGVYHACHRDLYAHERDWPFEVVNYMEFIGEAMGKIGFITAKFGRMTFQNAT